MAFASISAIPLLASSPRVNCTCKVGWKGRSLRNHRPGALSLPSACRTRTASSMQISEGDQVPNITVTTDDGDKLSLDSMKGQKMILFFYPKASTSGCTREAAAFQEKLKDFTEKNCKIVGASRDNPGDNSKFKSQLGLEYPLLCDEEGQLTEIFGVYKLRKKFGKEFMGIERSTFLISEDGKLEKAWRDVQVDGHVDDIAAAVASK